MRQVAVFCYDVATVDKAGRRRLTRVAKLLERYGTRVQDSVFEVRMDDRAVSMIRDALMELMDLAQDSLRIYRVDESAIDRAEHIGRRPEYEFLGQTLIF
jgi:CRISPR-associated protein Cas2